MLATGTNEPVGAGPPEKELFMFRLTGLLTLVTLPALLVYPVEQPKGEQPITKRLAGTDVYGDPLPPGAVARLGTTRLRLGGYVYGLAFSRDGKMIASGSIDNTVRLWDAATGREIRTFGGHDPWVTSVALSPDGKTIASAGADRAIRLSDVATGRQTRLLKGHGGVVSCLAFSPDGKTLASGSGVISGGDRTLRVWQAATGKELYNVPHADHVRSVAFSRDGKFLATACEDSSARLHDAATGKERRCFWGPKFATVTAVAVSPDGKILAAGGGRNENFLLLWDAPTGKQLHRVTELPGPVTSLAFSPDGKVLACGAGTGPSGSPKVRPIALWEPISGKELRRFGELGDYVTSMKFSPDGKQIATGHGGAIRLWDVATGSELLGDRGHHAAVYSVAFSPQGDTVVTGGSDGSIRLWDPATGKERRKAAKGVEYLGWVRYSADGEKLIWATNRAVYVREADGDGVGRRIGGDISTAAVSGGRDRLATLDSERILQLWNPSSGREIQRIGKSRGGKIALSDDGKFLALAYGDEERSGGAIYLWDATTGKKLQEFPLPAGSERTRTESFRSLAFSPNGKVLAMIGGNVAGVSLINSATGKELRRLPKEPHSTNCFVLTPGGKRIVTGNWDGIIRVYSLETGKEVGQLKGHRGHINRLALSPDGRLLASGSSDGTALIWDATALVGKQD